MEVSEKMYSELARRICENGEGSFAVEIPCEEYDDVFRVEGSVHYEYGEPDCTGYCQMSRVCCRVQDYYDTIGEDEEPVAFDPQKLETLIEA